MKRNQSLPLIRGILVGVIVFLYFFYYYFTQTPYPFNFGESEHAEPGYGLVPLWLPIIFGLFGFIIGYIWGQIAKD